MRIFTKSSRLLQKYASQCLRMTVWETILLELLISCRWFAMPKYIFGSIILDDANSQLSVNCEVWPASFIALMMPAWSTACSFLMIAELVNWSALSFSPTPVRPDTKTKVSQWISDICKDSNHSCFRQPTWIFFSISPSHSICMLACILWL